MALHCSHAHCYPDDSTCQAGHQTIGECPYYQAAQDAATTDSVESRPAELTGRRVSWTGSAMGLSDLEPLAVRSRLLLIGLAGAANAGKTTFLALLYSLLRQGQPIPGYRFAGSYTLPGWELLAGFLTFEDGSNQVSFPPHTTRNAGRVPGLLHLALRDADEHLLDVLFTDAPGEWFNEWRSNQASELGEGAAWIHRQADGFLLFADCEELIGPERGATRAQIQMVADRLLDQLGTRPLGLVWAKSDFGELRPAIRDSIQQRIQAASPRHYREFAVSVERREPQWHAQVLEAVAWLLATQQQEPGQSLPPLALPATDDLFLLRRSLLA
ncbi:MAG: TRAFAC clade GTPase domain-containing protein [Janthinobacterium lividum]